MYYVTVTYRKNATNKMVLFVYREDDLFLQTVDYGGDNPWNINSASCLMECAPGEHIYVLGTSPGSVFGHITVPYTSFSVYMLYGQGEIEIKL